MAESIEQLRIYTSARQAEDAVYELVKLLPADQQYPLGNDLRRASGAVSHYIMESHRLYSYRLKLDALAGARREAEITQKLLGDATGLSGSEELIEDYTSILKQSWGLTKWLKAKLAEKSEGAEVSAKEELAAARS